MLRCSQCSTVTEVGGRILFAETQQANAFWGNSVDELNPSVNETKRKLILPQGFVLSESRPELAFRNTLPR